MKLKRFYLILLIILFGLFIACNTAKEKIQEKESKFEWINNKDSVSTIIEKDNYLFVIKKSSTSNTTKAFADAPMIPSSLAKEMAESYEANSRAFRGKRAFCVTIPSKDVLDYLGAVGQDLSAVRIYFGAYPRSIDQDHPQGKFSVFLVAVDNNQRERYVDDTNSPLRIVNLGTLCPTICPPASDPNSIYARAGLSSIPQ